MRLGEDSVTEVSATNSDTRVRDEIEIGQRISFTMGGGAAGWTCQLDVGCSHDFAGANNNTFNTHKLIIDGTLRMQFMHINQGSLANCLGARPVD